MIKVLDSKVYKACLLNIFILSATALSSCQDGISTDKKVNNDERSRNITTNSSNITPYPPILDLFACKPAENAFVAAHRGTHIGSEYPENALISLQALVNNKVPFAEIDVARLKDGTHIIFHDGTWERRAVGPTKVLSLPLARTTWEQSQELLLKDTNGSITASRPSSLNDVLAYAKDKIYLEIDFKSSASEEEVIAAIKAADMIDQVILISYNTEQALRLHALEPKAVLSVGLFKPIDITNLEKRGIPIGVMAAWIGRSALTKEFADELRKHKIPILAASFFELDEQIKESGKVSLYTEFAKMADLIVSDSAFDAQQALEITGETLRIMESCIANN